ncbi:MAG: hypothetical protein FWF44_03885 [Defluviitaleaceae bacterium]|nr:hypothetical protein [Defluviitaleaceae bacterium]
MADRLFENTRVASYFLWERTQHSSPLDLWRCVEDVARFLKREDMLRPEDMAVILKLGADDEGYIAFVRHIAYRIYIFTNRDDALANWYAAEWLLGNNEWRQAMAQMAAMIKGS